jgi:hypothetical protein
LHEIGYTITEIIAAARECVLALQELLHTPDMENPARADALKLLKLQPLKYKRTVRQQARSYPMPEVVRAAYGARALAAAEALLRCGQAGVQLSL